MRINAKGIYYRELNRMIREAVENRETEIILDHVNGQYYIADGIANPDLTIIIHGIPGNDLAAFMDGPTVIVYNDAQDNVGNTMNSGKVIIHGSAGDVLGYSMRGGKLHIRGDVGYRVGIHMKGYQDHVPIIVVGDTAGNFLGEYMAGGILVLLGLDASPDQPLVGDYLGTGMHGGVMYIRGKVDPFYMGKEVRIEELTEQDEQTLSTVLGEYCEDFDLDFEHVRWSTPFTKLISSSHRPYGQLYAH